MRETAAKQKVNRQTGRLLLPEGWLLVRDRWNWSLYRPTGRGKGDLDLSCKGRALVGHYAKLWALIDALVDAKLLWVSGEKDVAALVREVQEAKAWAQECKERVYETWVEDE